MNNVILISVPEEKLESIIQNAVEKVLAKNDANKEQMQNELLSRKEAAKFLGVSIATIDNWTKQGKIKKHYNGSAVRFKRAELEISFQNNYKYKRG